MSAIPNGISTECRIVLLASSRVEVLVPFDTQGVHLLRLSVLRHQRWALQIDDKLAHEWGVHVFLIDILASEENESACVFAVPVEGSTSDRFRPVRVEELSEGELSSQERASLHMCVHGTGALLLARATWYMEAIAWVEEVTGGRVARPNGFRQFNAGEGFSLVRFTMQDGQAFWLKATGVPNLHEKRLTERLTELASAYLPRYVATRSDWNAWLTAEEGLAYQHLPTELPELERLLLCAVRSLAGLQLATMGHEESLLAAGAFDQRIPVLRSHSDHVFAYVEEAMAVQTSQRVAPLSTRRLRELRFLLMEAFAEAEELGLKPVILHGDMNLGNLVFQNGRCLFVDWAEGYLGHPLSSLQHLLLLNPIQDAARKRSLNRKLQRAYRDAVKPVCRSESVEHGFASMPLIAAFSALYGRGDWLYANRPVEVHRQAYARCLARHMDAAAQDYAQRRTCHAS